MNRPLFIYGSMLDPDVRSIIFGCAAYLLDPVPALLLYHSRKKLPDESYPILVEDPRNQTQGALLFDLEQEQWDRVNFFESDEYELVDITVLNGDDQIHAVFYGAGKIQPGASESWTLEWWQENHKTDFLAMIQPYMSLFGKTDLTTAEALWEKLQQEKG